MCYNARVVIEEVMTMEERVGRITHYFAHIGVAALVVESAGLKVGDTIHIKGHTTDVTQTVHSLQLEHEPIQEAKPGMDIGLQVSDHVREHDVVFKVASA
jgi:translation elongation factor EF-1alpha